MSINDAPEKVKQHIDTSQTLAHIKRVGEVILRVNTALLQRAIRHDSSKLHEPEASIFAIYGPRLKGMTYGSEEYKQCLAEMGKALEHHYANNRHHPEHYSNGIDGMSLIDLMEMFCDWLAATERHADGDIVQSIHHNAERFGISDQLKQILLNTVEVLKEEGN